MSSIGRRKALQTAGVAVGGIGVAGLETGRSAGDDAKPVGTGGPDNDRGLPVAADGRLVTIYTRFSSENDRFVVELTLHSPVLNERHGSSAFNYESVKAPAGFAPQQVREGNRSQYSVQTQRVIGTPSEHRTAERQIRKQRASVGETHPLHTPTTDGNVPLFSYASESDASSGDEQDRTSPMNVAWEGKGPSGINSDMEAGNNGPNWTGVLSDIKEAKVPLSANLPDGGTKSTTAHVMKSVEWCPTEQNHVRSYDVPVSEIGAIGQAHRDPCDHRKGGKHLPIGDTDWRIDQARSAVGDT